MEDPQDTNIIVSSETSDDEGTDSSAAVPDDDDEGTDSSAAVPDDDEVLIDIPENSRRCIYRVLPSMRGGKNTVYDPVVVSIGPYHHGKPQYDQMEKYKKEVLVEFMANSVKADEAKGRDFYYNEILTRINEVRNNYEKDGMLDSYDDKKLAEIILCDACFVISFMEMEEPYLVDRISTQLGAPIGVLATRDLLMLENQIPFWIIKHLLGLRYGEEEGDELVRIYISWECFSDSEVVSALPWIECDEENQPLHLLEAHRLALLHKENIITKQPQCHYFLSKISGANLLHQDNNSSKEPKCHYFLSKISRANDSEQSVFESLNLPYRSVTYLQSKGIVFRPSSVCLKDIKFDSYHLYGVLYLPMLYVNRDTKVLFSNVIAIEMSPESESGWDMTSYVNFMKSLIDTPRDVMELRERRILYSNLGNDEEVIKVFKEIDTYGVESVVFEDVIKKINRHCSSRGKTWMADLFHSYCRSPWSVIALFAATFVLCLTFIQTYYTVQSAS